MKQSARDYQSLSIDLIRKEFQKGNRKVLLFLATGAGKTFTFCEMIKATNQNGLRSMILVRGRKLVDQASKRLFREHVPHGVVMANHWNYRPHLSVQACSIDTLIARGIRPKADLIIIDEADLFTEDSQAGQIISEYPDAFIVAVTATPWLPHGISHLADSIVHPITMRELIDRGYLCDFRYFAPSEPNLIGVKVSSSTHDFVNDQLEEAMVQGQLTGKIIDHWKKIAPDRKTILFAVNIHHSKLLTERFKNAGIRAEHCDADTPDNEREQIIRRLESGETQVISNVGIFCRGVDIPSIGAIISARPTKSLNLFIQQAGRGTRTYPGKSDCILLDHAGNLLRHGFPTEEHEVNLKGDLREETFKKETKICKNCFAAYRGPICPECGQAPPVRDGVEAPEETEAELKEIKPREKTPIEYAVIELEKQREVNGFKKEWTYNQLLKRFPLEECKPFVSDRFIEKETRTKEKAFSNSPFKKAF